MDLSFLTNPIGFDFVSPLRIGYWAQVHKTYNFHVVKEVIYLAKKPGKARRRIHNKYMAVRGRVP